jgi:DeoR/GlpR family transcriptional regulator of sugar metabolism
MIGRNIKVSSLDITTHWDVSQKTAKRDIADLKRKEYLTQRRRANRG